MKRRILLLLSTAMLAFAASAASADQFLLGFTGFDYHLSSPTSTHYLDVGDGWRSLGFVTSVDPGLLGSYVDFSVNEYTYYMNDLTVATTFVFGTFLEADFSNTTGRTRYDEDPISGGTHGVYGTAPPNGGLFSEASCRSLTNRDRMPHRRGLVPPLSRRNNATRPHGRAP